MKVLLLEDDASEVAVCENAVAVYTEKIGDDIQLIVCRTLEEALDHQDDFDAAIVDLRIDHAAGAGNDFVRQLRQKHVRVPVAILTGTPDDFEDAANVGIYKKGEENATYAKLFERFAAIEKTGLNAIIGKDGTIEQYFDEILHKNIFPSIDRWMEYAAHDQSHAQGGLSRHVLSHIALLLDDDHQDAFPEEMYIWPALDEVLRTGCVVKCDEEGQFYLVMNPACDLVTRNGGGPKTDQILIVAIEPYGAIVAKELEPIRKQEKKKSRLRNLAGNNVNLYHHWLPRAHGFEGGFANFRLVQSFDKAAFTERFGSPVGQVAPSYIKDIVARFSSYYARQGQPDVLSTAFVDDHTE